MDHFSILYTMMFVLSSYCLPPAHLSIVFYNVLLNKRTFRSPNNRTYYNTGLTFRCVRWHSAEIAISLVRDLKTLHFFVYLISTVYFLVWLDFRYPR